MELNWQKRFHKIKDRGRHLLQTEKWSDCRFLVGAAPLHQKLFACHKIILAMASSVFEEMFFGSLADENDPILLPDVQPDAFQTMLEYIYSDRVNISSFEKTRELCYVAKKYQLPDVVRQCILFMWSDLNPRNACRAYEFGKLFDESRLMQRSMELIAGHTREVLADPSFTNIEMSTLMAILDQDKLNIDSELDLFNALLRFANDRGMCRNDYTQQVGQQQQEQSAFASASRGSSPSAEESKMVTDVNEMMPSDDDQFNDENVYQHIMHSPDAGSSVSGSDVSVADAAENEEGVAMEAAPLVSCDQPSSSAAAAAVAARNLNYFMDVQRLAIDEEMLKKAVKKIRFLTMTPQQFAEGPARSKLLQGHEALAILIKISSPSVNDCPMPKGFSSSRSSRNYCHQRDMSPFQHTQTQNNFSSAPVNNAQKNRANSGLFLPFVDTQRSYCVRTVIPRFDFRNANVTDCGLTFQVDRNIWITGVQVSTQVICGELNKSAGLSDRYTEVLYAHIQDLQGSRLSYTHCTSRVRYDSLLEISFDRPVCIYRNQIYKVFVVFNKIGWYPMYKSVPDVVCNRVKFRFNVGDPTESVRDGLIRAIVFSTPQENNRPL